MDLAMFGLQERVPDPKAKLVEVGVAPTRPTSPRGATAPLGVHVVGCEVQAQ